MIDTLSPILPGFPCSSEDLHQVNRALLAADSAGLHSDKFVLVLTSHCAIGIVSMSGGPKVGNLCPSLKSCHRFESMAAAKAAMVSCFHLDFPPVIVMPVPAWRANVRAFLRVALACAQSHELLQQNAADVVSAALQQAAKE
ncbi:hypothetical protein [Pseudomonas sp. KCJK9000]|uniref:hypothetical protein n=1 Tax=Pseudomonas sp. KCJK9000 TaxID=3344566 RepID=UPI003905EFCF